MDRKMNSTDRASHPSRVQLERLIDILEINLDLAKGFSKVPSARDDARKKWERIALELNSMGGSIKTWKQWTKYWADKKSAVKKKAALRFRTRNMTGGGGATEVELSNAENRILTIMGGEKFAVGDRHLEINPFEVTVAEENIEEDSPSILTSYQLTVEQTSPLTMTSQPQPGYDEVCIPETSYQTGQTVVRMVSPGPSTSQGVSPPRTPPRPSRQANPPQPLTPSSAGTHPERRVRRRLMRNESSNAANASRTRRRIRQPTLSPPSQRRSHLTTLSERFLSLEEQRVEIERQNALNSEKLAEAMMCIGEGIRLWGENLRK